MDQDPFAVGGGFMVPCIDEFGGYSSRLRIPELEGASSKPRSVKARPQTVTTEKSLGDA